MKYCMLLQPHRNLRYQEGVVRLSCAELTNQLRCLGMQAPVQAECRLGAHFLTFEGETLPDYALDMLSAHSHMQLLFSEEGGALTPLCGAKAAFLGEDLAYVQKYKGKTNEAFTMHLINQALYASCLPKDGRITLLDPMCGRGTTLFQALNRGFSAAGAEIHPTEVQECDGYFKRYLEFHRMKHTRRTQSLTRNGRGVPVVEYAFSSDAEAFRAGDVRALRLIACDGMVLPELLKKERFHLIVADLPYGVQHAPGAQGKKTAAFDEVIAGNLRAWSGLLAPGGAMALAFNVHTLPLERVRAMMEQAGLEVMRGEGYDGLEHFVEQAIQRDLAVGRAGSAR